MSRRSQLRLIASLAVLLATTGCSHLFREKRTPFPSSAPHSAPWRLNREFLLPQKTSRIVFVVEVFGGAEPRTEALDHLVEVASRYGERSASWVWAGGMSAPDVAFDRNGDLRCPEGPLDDKTSYVFIRYVGTSSPGLYGRTGLLNTGAECGARQIYSIQVSQDTLARQRMLWLTRARLEEYDLIHEYGHVLGLGSNPAHGFYPYYPDLSAGDHCVNPECALAGPHPRALLYRIYRTGMTFRYNRDFCAACRRDIEQAKRHWLTGEVFPPSRRLPTTDLSKWIAKLEDKDFNDNGRAFILLNHTKEVMPALMKRMYTLPADGPESPRATADWIARAIVMQEALKRAGKGFRTDWAMGDRSREMQWWWMKEGRRFMSGGDWELPETVSLIPEGHQATQNGAATPFYGPDTPPSPPAPATPAKQSPDGPMEP